MKNFSWYSRCAGRHSNRTSPLFKSLLRRLHSNSSPTNSLLFIGIQLPTRTKRYEPLYDHTNVCRPYSWWRSFDHCKNLLKIQSKNMMTFDIGLKLIVLHTQLMERRNRFHFTGHSASGEWQTW